MKRKAILYLYEKICEVECSKNEKKDFKYGHYVVEICNVAYQLHSLKVLGSDDAPSSWKLDH